MFPCCEHCESDWDYSTGDDVPCGESHDEPCPVDFCPGGAGPEDR